MWANKLLWFLVFLLLLWFLVICFGEIAFSADVWPVLVFVASGVGDTVAVCCVGLLLFAVLVSTEMFVWGRY